MIKEVPFGFPRVFGFGDGRHSRGRYPIEYYYSQGMQHSLFGLSTGYLIASVTDSVAIPSLTNIRWFADAGGITYAMGSDGKIFQEQTPGFSDWRAFVVPGNSAAGNGMVGDQKGRVLYMGNTDIGKIESGTGTDAWKAGVLTSYANHPADTYEDMVLIGNKSTVAILDSADVVNSSAFTLPSAMTVDCLKSGKNGILLGVNLSNRGVLILWNTQTDRSTAPWIWTNGNIQAIERTDTGWVVVTQKEILLTNGYTTRKLFSILDDPMGFTNYTIAPQGLIVVNNKLFLLQQSSTTNSFARVKAGLYIFDLATTLFEFVPMSTMNTRSVFPLAIYAPKTATQEVFIGYRDSFLLKNYIGKLTVSGGSAATYMPQILAASPTDKAAEAVILNFGVNTVLSAPQPLTFNIAVKLYTFKRQLWGINTTNATAAAGNQLRIDGRGNSFTHAQIGDEVTILEGLNAGLVAHVTAIANQGLINETWTLDTTFPNNTESGVYMNVQPFQLIAKKTIAAAASIPELYFNVRNRYRGKKFLIKVVIDSANVQMELHDGLFVYDDLGLSP